MFADIYISEIPWAIVGLIFFLGVCAGIALCYFGWPDQKNDKEEVSNIRKI